MGEGHNAPSEGDEHVHEREAHVGRHAEQQRTRARDKRRVLHTEGAGVLLRRLREDGVLRNAERGPSRALFVRLPLSG